MEQREKKTLKFEIDQISPSFCKTTITVPHSIVDVSYVQAINAQKKSVRPYGFHHDNVPEGYIKQNFENNIKNHLQEFLFKHFVLSFLYNQIRETKLNIAGDPRLTSIHINNNEDAIFDFDISLFPKIEFQNWKYYPFRAPKRKKYKDLDRQAIEFMREERHNKKEYNQSAIQTGDWVSFDAWLANHEKKAIFGRHKENLWVRIGNEEADREMQQLFVGKKIGALFYTNEDVVQEYFGTQIGSNYNFGVKIKDVLPNAYFCFDQFKRQFRLKTKKESLKRLIEVFSFRNDISQRQATVEEAFNLMFSKYKIEIPNYLILRQQKKVLADIRKNPDYHVYKNQKEFDNHIRNLAEKQIKEIILIDQLASKEKVKVTHEDMASYLNLTKRPRMKEFIYFKMPETKIDCQETPVSSELITQQCLREKTLNYIIYNFTRK
ncbi:trigger factor [Candidatus Dependentiae bacterium]